MYKQNTKESASYLIGMNVKQRAGHIRGNVEPTMSHVRIVEEATSWLGDTVLAERLHVITNDITSRPLCYCGIALEFECNGKNRYRQFCSRKCGNADAKLKAVRNASITEARLSDIDENGLNSFQRYSTFTKYNASMRAIVYEDGTNELQRLARINSGKAAARNHILYSDMEYRLIRGFAEKSLFRMYKTHVWTMTNKNYRTYKDVVDPGGLRSREYHLDHMVSVREGFEKNVPPYIIADINNLIVIPAFDNLSKGKTSSQTLNELFSKIFPS